MSAAMQITQPRTDRWGIERLYENPGNPGKMKTELARWLKIHKKKRAEFAADLGVSLSYVNQICTGAKIPARQVINDIARLTDSQVNWTHWPNSAE